MEKEPGKRALQIRSVVSVVVIVVLWEIAARAGLASPLFLPAFTAVMAEWWTVWCFRGVGGGARGGVYPAVGGGGGGGRGGAGGGGVVLAALRGGPGGFLFFPRLVGGRFAVLFFVVVVSFWKAPRFKRR